MCMTHDQNKSPCFAEIRARGLERIRQHSVAIAELAAAVSALDDAFWLAITERTQDDHQALRNAQNRLSLLVESGVAR